VDRRCGTVALSGHWVPKKLSTIRVLQPRRCTTDVVQRGGVVTLPLWCACVAASGREGKCLTWETTQGNGAVYYARAGGSYLGDAASARGYYNPDLVCQNLRIPLLTSVPGGKFARRTYRAIPSLASVGINYDAYDDDEGTVATSLAERVFYHKYALRVERAGKRVATIARYRPIEPPNKPQVMCVLQRYFQSIVRSVGVSAKITLEQFLAYYHGRRLSLYRKAAEVVRCNAFRDVWAVCLSFDKWEKLLRKETRVVPRVIHPRKPMYNVVLGQYIRHLEHHYYHAIQLAYSSGGYPTPVVMKGFNCYQQGAAFAAAWQDLGGDGAVVAIGGDAKRYDQHITEPLLSFEHKIYRAAYPGDTLLKHVLKQQLSLKAVCSTKESRLRYASDPIRCSGDMNTALGNCLLMCGFWYAFFEKSGIPLCDVRLFDNGDDSLVMVKREWLSRIVNDVPDFFMEIFGIEFALESPVEVLEEVEFCQTHPVYDGKRWRMVRNFPASLSKDSTVTHRVAHTSLPAYLHTLGECGLALTSGIPVLQEYYSCMMRACGYGLSWNPLEGSGMAMLARGLPATYSNVDPLCRVSFYRAFGINPDHQRAMERRFLETDAKTLVVEPSTA